MNTCDTCKHWAKEVAEHNVGSMIIISLYRECTNPKVNGESRELWYTPQGAHRAYAWEVVKGEVSPVDYIESEGKHTVPLDQATPEAADTHGLCFLTGPKFGCIHHEQGQ